MNKTEILISIGFLCEISLFMIAGILFLTSPFRSFIFLVVGILIAYVVGRAMINNAIEKYREKGE